MVCHVLTLRNQLCLLPFLDIYLDTQEQNTYTCVINSRSYCPDPLYLSLEHSILAPIVGLLGLVIVSAQSSPLSKFACQRGACAWGCQTTLPFLLNHHKRAFFFLSPRSIYPPSSESGGDTGRVAYRLSHSPEETERRLGKAGLIGQGGGLDWDLAPTRLWPACVLHK